MKILGPTRHDRLNEALALVYLAASFFIFFSLISYSYQDPSWDTVSGTVRSHNLTGHLGARIADVFFQLIGLSAFAIPLLILVLAWKWLRSSPIVIRPFNSRMVIPSRSLGSISKLMVCHIL